MPIEIKELYIKAVVNGEEKTSTCQLSAEEVAKLRKELTKEVTENVLRILEQKNER
jgi:Family of unknown function (DUF5908)